MNVIYDLITHGGDEVTHRQIIRNNCEDAEIRYSCGKIGNGDHVLDIGGNIGLHTINFAKHLVPNGKLVAFEPMSKNYDVLCQNVKKHNLENNVLAINAALSHESKQSQYIINPKNMGDCRGHVWRHDSGFLENEFFEEETVNQTTLDDFFANNNTIGIEWNKIKFIKMDTQGSEISILQGASNCFKEPFNGTIFLEYWPPALLNNNQDINWFFDFIKEHMFSVFKLPLDSNVRGIPIVNPSSIEEIKDYYYEWYQKDPLNSKDNYCNLVLQRTPIGPTRKFSITNAFTP